MFAVFVKRRQSIRQMFHRHSINVDNIILPYGEVEKKKRKADKVIGQREKKKEEQLVPAN